MRIKEIINELSFYGRPCTKDCSGTKAGWEWERKHNVGQKQSTPSNSFNNGTEIAISQAKQDRRPIGPSIRGEKGRFQKFQAVKETSVNEVLNSPVEWEWDEQSPNYITALFNLNDRPFLVELTKQEFDGYHVWDLQFKDALSQDPFGVTGQMKGQSQIVFATVIDIIKNFKQQYPEEVIKFTAKEDSRQKLYSHIVALLQRAGMQTKSARSPTGSIGYLVK